MTLASPMFPDGSPGLVPDVPARSDGAEASGLRPWPGFAPAADAAVRHLHARFGLGLWTVGRVIGDDLQVLAAAGPWAALARPGSFARWALCPKPAERGGDDRVIDLGSRRGADGAATLVRAFSHVGVPLLTADGALCASLCAFDRLPPDRAVLTEVMEGAVVLARMLTTILAREQDAADRSAEAAAAYALAARDGLTGLLNARGWRAALDVEEQRVRRYGGPVSVLVLDLDELKHINDSAGHAKGDATLQSCARVLSHTSRPGDVCARIGGDEFTVLAVECDPVSVRALAVRLRGALRAAGVEASLGSATRRVAEPLEKTVERADQAMLRDKQRRHRLEHAPQPPRPRSAGPVTFLDGTGGAQA